MDYHAEKGHTQRGCSQGLPLRVMGNSIFYFLPDRVFLLFHHK